MPAEKDKQTIIDRVQQLLAEANARGVHLQLAAIRVRQYLRGRNGVYALYKRDKLYYVGLATNLRSRLKQHLRDRHGESWDRFSVYLTITDSHLKDMESLLLRIIHPSGNKQSGRFYRCENLLKRLTRDIKALQREEITGILGVERRAIAGRDSADDRPVLAPYVVSIRRNRLRGNRARVRGRGPSVSAKALVLRDGSIVVRGVRGRKFKSPSMAAQHVLGHNANGSTFWKYERSPGEWVRLKHLRD
jgi:predicted GIY-YIG superfamily endonuclease